jgi:dTDP-glucose pyrophosphorylase
MQEGSILRSGSTIRDALKCIDRSATALSALFIMDDRKLIGTLTDGDIRRGLIKGFALESTVDEIMNRDFRYVLTEDLHAYKADLSELRKNDIRFVPVVSSSMELSEVLDLDKIRDVLPLDAFILAGGKGERLLPVTRSIPKPMIEVGDKPIIGHNVSRMARYGIKNIYISINYLGEKIVEHFGDGQSYGASVKYVREEKPLGTIGSISLIEDELKDDVLVMNSDLLTNIDLSDFYRSFIRSRADMAVVVKPFYQDFPYAVISADADNYVTAVQEKPRYTYYTNAGIYIIRKKLISELRKGEVMDATDFMEQLLKSGRKIYSYPIINYWLDIGKPEDLRKALEDIKHLHI